MRLAGAVLAILCISACDETMPEPDPAPESRAPAPTAVDRSGFPKIIAFGDSLTAGLGIAQDEAYPAVLQELLDAEGHDYEVINAGVSGETSAGGVRRLEWVLEDRDVVALIVALGGNDGLRGLPPSEMKKNLGGILDTAEARGIPVLLAGLSIGEAPNDRYVRDFVAVYEELAEERGVTYMPSLLENVAGVEALNQPDGTHPNADGARIIATNVLEYLKPLLP